jgi:hypothetical protein
MYACFISDLRIFISICCCYCYSELRFCLLEGRGVEIRFFKADSSYLLIPSLFLFLRNVQLSFVFRSCKRVERPELGLGELESMYCWTGTTYRAAPIACSDRDWSEESYVGRSRLDRV